MVNTRLSLNKVLQPMGGFIHTTSTGSNNSVLGSSWWLCGSGEGASPLDTAATSFHSVSITTGMACSNSSGTAQSPVVPFQVGKGCYPAAAPHGVSRFGHLPWLCSRLALFAQWMCHAPILVLCSGCGPIHSGGGQKISRCCYWTGAISCWLD